MTTDLARDLPASGQTDVSRPLALVAVTAWLVLIASVGLARHVLPAGGAWLRPGPFQQLFATLGEIGQDGFRGANRRVQEAMDELERTLEDSSPLMELTLAPVQRLLSGWGGAGNEQVYVGRRGWLYYRPGFDYLVGPAFLDPALLTRRRRSGLSWEDPPAPDPRPALVDFHRQLAARGIRLLLLPVPSKVMIHPDQLAPAYAGRSEDEPPLHNPSFARLRADLEAAGLLVYDPSGTLARVRRGGGEAYLRTDSHWSPSGVDAVARELAARIRMQVSDLPGPRIAWRREVQDHRGQGDLAKMLRISPPSPQGTLTLPDRGQLFPPRTVRLERVVDPRGRPWRGDPRAEVLLLGDSFTNVFSDPGLGWGSSAGLAEQLAFHLGHGVDRIAINNASATGVRRRLAQELAAGRPRLEQKKLVVYQIAVRELVVGTWRPVALPGSDP